MAEVEIKKQKENEVKLKIEIDKLKVNSYLDKVYIDTEDNNPVGLTIQKEQGYTFVVKPKKLLKN